MVAGHVVPLDPIGVEVVEDGEAGLGAGRLLPGRSVVRLGEAGAVNTQCQSGYSLHVKYQIYSSQLHSGEFVAGLLSAKL